MTEKKSDDGAMTAGTSKFPGPQTTNTKKSVKFQESDNQVHLFEQRNVAATS